MRKFSVLLGLLAGTAFALQHTGDGTAEAVAMSMAGTDCVFCDEDACPGGSHDAWEPTIADPNYTRNGGVHLDYECYPGTCSTMHGPRCGGSPDPFDDPVIAMVDMDRLRGSIEANDVQAVKDLLASHTESTALNIERSAVEVTDCRGAVVAHFPVGRKFLDRVSAE